MLKIIRKFPILISIIFVISACKTNNLGLLSTKEATLKSEPNYQSYLALEYLNFSRKLLAVEDKKTSEYFAKKGLDTFERQDIIPENPLKWNADSKQIKEMIFMQKRLEEINSITSLRTQLPIQMAHLHYLYDCWISRESQEIFAGEEIANCRITFSKLLEEIETFYSQSKIDKTAKTQISEDRFDRFEVSFDIENSNLNDQSTKQIKTIFDHLKSVKGQYNLIIVGNADDNTDNLINQNLAKDRMITVKNYLIANGVVDHLISLNYEGEDLPDIVTSDLVANKINRNVAVYVFYNQSNFNQYPLPLLQNLYLKDQIKKTRDSRGLKN